MAKFGEFDEDDEVDAGKAEVKRVGSMGFGTSHPKAHLILEGSEQFEWGVVKDCHGCINYVPEGSEVVGVWHKYGSGTFWVSLLTPLKALEDLAVQLHVKLAKSREEDISRMGPLPAKKSRSRAKKEPVPDEGSETLDRLSALRAKLSTAGSLKE